MTKHIKHVAFFGSATLSDDDVSCQSAFQTAKLLAENGFEIVNGGGPGIMRAASQGAKTCGGKVIGVTYYPKDVKNFEGRDDKNPIDVEIKTKNYLERTLMLLKEAECYLVFKGGTGTISEFGMAWGMSKLYFGHHKPFILFGSYWEEIMNTLEENLEIDKQEQSTYEIVSSPLEVLEAINRFEKKMDKIKHIKKENGPFRI